METPIYHKIIQSIQRGAVYFDDIVGLLPYYEYEKKYYDEQEAKEAGAGGHVYSFNNKVSDYIKVLQSLQYCQRLIYPELNNVFTTDEGQYKRMCNRLTNMIDTELEKRKNQSGLFTMNPGQNEAQIDYLTEVWGQISDGYERLPKKQVKEIMLNEKNDGVELDIEQAVKEFINYNRIAVPSPEELLGLYTYFLNTLLNVVNNSIAEISGSTLEGKADYIPDNLHHLESAYDKLIYLQHSGILDFLKEQQLKSTGKVVNAKLCRVIGHLFNIKPQHLYTLIGYVGDYNQKKPEPYTLPAVEKALNALTEAGFKAPKLENILLKLSDKNR